MKLRPVFDRSSSSSKFLAVLFLVCGLLSPPAKADFAGKVIRVADGDTVTVLDADNVQHRVRLTGIDAPERGQPFGTASRDHLGSLIAGKQVTVESSSLDRYGRVLGKIVLDGNDVNLSQVQAGMAWWYRYYAKTQPETDQKLYESAENGAKLDGRGLWSDPAPINPYEWRKGRR